MRDKKATTTCIYAVIAGILIWTMLASFFAERSLATNQKPLKKSDQALQDLHDMGMRIADAVVAKDIPTLLNYGRRDLRSEDENSLRNQKSELYCYLFDSSCITWKKQRSVYEKISQAQRRGIKVVDGGKSPYDGHRYASLFFYDSSVVSEKMLRSSGFLCDEGRDRVSVWRFKMVDGQWEPVTPFFDFGTDSLCPPD